MYTLDITIAWEEPTNQNGIITFYEVTVAQTDDSDIVYSDNVTITSVTQSVIVLPFTNYTVTVTASTSAGQGDPESVVEVSPEAGKWSNNVHLWLHSLHDMYLQMYGYFCCIYNQLALPRIMYVLFAEPEKVENVQLTFSSEGSFDSSSRMYTLDMTISWDEPVNQNGVITSYEVAVAQTDNPSNIVYADDSLTVTSVIQSVMVLPFTNYTVTVTASTSAGEGDPESVVELSPEAGKQSNII